MNTSANLKSPSRFLCCSPRKRWGNVSILFVSANLVCNMHHSAGVQVSWLEFKGCFSPTGQQHRSTVLIPVLCREKAVARSQLFKAFSWVTTGCFCCNFLLCSSPLALNNIACNFACLHLSSQTVTLMLGLLKRKKIKSLSVSFSLWLNSN